MSVYADSLFHIFLPSLDLVYDPFIFIELFSNEFLFSNYILILISDVTAPAAAATLSDDVLATITRIATEAATRAVASATEAATRAVASAAEAATAAASAAGESSLTCYPPT